MVAAAFFFSLMSLLVRVVGRDGQGVPTMDVVLARSLIVLAICWTALRAKGISPWGEEKRGILFVRGLLGFTALTGFYYALIHLPLADATVIQYTNPVWTALLAAAVLSERIGRREVALSLASLGGVILMARPTLLFGGAGPGLPAGPVAAGVFGAVVSAAAYVTVRFLGRTEHPLVVVFWFALVGAIGSLPFVAVGFTPPGPADLVLLLGVGITTYLGQIFITMGLKEERAGKAMGVAYLQIVFAAVWGVLVLSEIPDRWTVSGALVIVACTWALGRVRGPAPG